MKLPVPRFFKAWLFQGKTPKTFPAIRIPAGEINEQVVINADGEDIDVSGVHCVVCHRPFLVAIWIKAPHHGNAELAVVKKNVRCAIARLQFTRAIEVDQRSLSLFEVKAARNFQTGYLRQQLLLRYFRNKDTLLEGCIYGALYAYPRKVIIVSYADGDYFNIFPMDFQCIIEGALIVLGLRTTNFTIDKIIASGKVVVSDSGSLSLETIYQLGRNHSAAPPSRKELPFDTIDSDRLKFPVPAVSARYYEIEISKSTKVGSHMLMIGTIVNTKQMASQKPAVHHIHFFQSFQSDYKNA